MIKKIFFLILFLSNILNAELKLIENTCKSNLEMFYSMMDMADLTLKKGNLEQTCKFLDFSLRHIDEIIKQCDVTKQKKFKENKIEVNDMIKTYCKK